VNHRITLPERIVLPRLSEVIDSGVLFLKERTSSKLLEFVVLDFKDAFKQLRVHANERRYLSGRCSRGWFMHLRILFGIVSGPLVWGRIAAAIIHAGHATVGFARPLGAQPPTPGNQRGHPEHRVLRRRPLLNALRHRKGALRGLLDRHPLLVCARLSPFVAQGASWD
jgi:hypothetical protein